MRVKVVLFARLRREAGAGELDLDVPEHTDLRALADRLERERGLRLSGCMAAINEVYAAPEQVLEPGDEVAFLPPVAGGSDGATHCHLGTEALSMVEADRFLVRPSHGAQAYFVGTVRSPNMGKVVHAIDYEGYEPMARREMLGAAEQARARHGTDLRIYIVHRLGRLLPGEASILIGVASPHRRAALEACDFLIEHLKVHLPVWKHEHDEDGEHWVSGQTGHPTL